MQELYSAVDAVVAVVLRDRHASSGVRLEQRGRPSSSVFWFAALRALLSSSKKYTRLSAEVIIQVTSDDDEIDRRAPAPAGRGITDG